MFKINTLIKLLNNYLNTTIENEKIDGYIIHEIKIIKEVEYGVVFSVLYSVKVNAADTRWGNPVTQPDLAVGKQMYASYINENSQLVLNITILFNLIYLIIVGIILFGEVRGIVYVLKIIRR